MMPAQLIELLGWMWGGFAVYWVAAPRDRKTEQISEPRVYRLVRLSILVITFALLFANWTAIGALGWEFLPQYRWLASGGFVLAAAGLAIAIWARIHLGQYWSDQVVIKVDHQLIRTGPYAYMRHPIYSGVLLGVAGTALVLDEWRGVLAFFILLTNYAIKAKREENVLAGAFAEEFAEHKKQAGFLLPRFNAKS
jgi:protein-S-isoprenylcysteine O-methyltransferase Ste14